MSCKCPADVQHAWPVLPDKLGKWPLQVAPHVPLSQVGAELGGGKGATPDQENGLQHLLLKLLQTGWECFIATLQPDMSDLSSSPALRGVAALAGFAVGIWRLPQPSTLGDAVCTEHGA